MKRSNITLLGNGLMILGLLLLFSALSGMVANRLSADPIAQLWANFAVLTIFIGAIIWLVGAQLSGRQSLEERYYLLRLKQRRRKL